MHAIVGDASQDSGADGRMLHIEAEIARLTNLVNRLAAGTGLAFGETNGSARPMFPATPGHVPPMSFDRGRARMVRNIIKQRRKREQHFSSCLLADPGWDMLLDLYAASYENRPVSVSSLCIAAAVPATTALRWIKTMEEEGHFVREQDPDDRRRIFIAISAEARAKMDDYFDEIGN